MKEIRRRIITVVLVIVILAGAVLLLYPTVADHLNRRRAARVITAYEETLSDVDEERYQELFDGAVAYNTRLITPGGFLTAEEREALYAASLDLDGTGIMGYVDIPRIRVTLPVYHGTDEEILQTSVGHVDWSSLPVGGETTHCILSGHSGLPSAKLFTDLDKLREKDTFTLNILNETLTYEVDRISVVLPYELDTLSFDCGMDYCTLVTCTPYGINTHRLLVRGRRVPNAEGSRPAVAEAEIIDPPIVGALLMFPLVVLLIVMLLSGKPERKAKIRDTEIPGRDDGDETRT